METEKTEKMITSDNDDDDDIQKNNGVEEQDNENEENDEDEDEEEESDKEEKKLEAEAESLERQVSENKYLYDVHMKLLDIFEKLGDLKSLRAAYKRFAEYFPLTPTIWLKWIRNEIKLATSALQKESVIQLFDKATEDYLSVSIWVEYVQFCLGNCQLEQTYAVVERGLNAAGLHTKQGSLLWDCLREIELVHLRLDSPLSDSWQQQAKKVADAFRRQLSVPLLDMENTYNEWQRWLNQLPEGHGIDPQLVDWGYQKALKLLEMYKTFEDNLMMAKDDEELFSVYREYINAMEDPATVLCLYERTVADLSLNTSLWMKYCLYTFNLGEISFTVSKRAIRNCPWCEELWVMRLRILEHLQCSNQEVTACFEQGLVAIAPLQGLNLWLSYLEYTRHTSESLEHLYKVFIQASEQLGETGDPACIVLRLQARLYARQKDMTNARRVWSTILRSSTHKGTASAWLEYANLEKQYGDSHHLKLLYQRALSSCVEWSQYIADDWIMYERECGSLKDILKCEEKCKEVIEGNQKLLSEKQAENSENRKRSYESNYNDGDFKVKRQKTVETSKQVVPKKKVLVSDIDSERAVFVSNMREDINEEKLQAFFPTASAICIPTDRKGSSRCYAYVQFSEKDEVDNALKRDREAIDGRPLFISKCLLDQTQRKNAFKYSTSSERNKLFVRGLPIHFTQENVEGIFRPYGAIAVRLVSHRSGRSKGLAYVEFNDEEKTNKALKATDQLNVSGHTLSVAISAPPPKKTDINMGGLFFNSEPVRHARSRLQIPLVPRSVQNKNAETAVQGTSKSNEDFRKMFLNKP